MTLSYADNIRILRDVMLGAIPPKNESDEEREAREAFAADLKHAQGLGFALAFPKDWEDDTGDRVDIADPKKHIQHPGSRGGHIIGYDHHGEPIYGKPHPHLYQYAEHEKAQHQTAVNTHVESLLHTSQHNMLGNGHPEWYSKPQVTHQLISGPKGSNPGGVYKSVNGNTYYVKHYKDPAQAIGEDLANRIYRSLGIAAPHSGLVKTGDPDQPVSYLSHYAEGLKTLEQNGLNEGVARKILHGFAADVLLANWDAVGTGHDNIMVDADNHVRRIDNGGSLLFRAQGGRKTAEQQTNVTEWESLSDPKKNPYYALVFKAAGLSNANELGQDALTQIDKIVELQKKTDNFAKMLPVDTEHLDPADHTAMLKMLNHRANYLANIVAPVIRDQLKKGHQFTHEEAVKGGQASHGGGGAPGEKPAEHAEMVKTGQSIANSPDEMPPGPWKIPNSIDWKVYEALAKAGAKGMSGGELAKHDWWAHMPKTVWPYNQANKLVAAGLAVKVGPKYILMPHAENVKPPLPSGADLGKFKKLPALMALYEKAKEQVMPHYTADQWQHWIDAVYKPAAEKLGAPAAPAVEPPASDAPPVEKTTVYATPESMKAVEQNFYKIVGQNEVPANDALIAVLNELHDAGDAPALAAWHQHLAQHGFNQFAQFALNKLHALNAEFGGFTSEEAALGGKASHGGGGGKVIALKLKPSDVSHAMVKLSNMFDVPATEAAQLAKLQSLMDTLKEKIVKELPEGEVTSLFNLAAYVQAAGEKWGTSDKATKDFKKMLADFGYDYTYESATVTPPAAEQKPAKLVEMPAPNGSDLAHADDRFKSIKSKTNLLDKQLQLINQRTNATSDIVKLAAWYWVLNSSVYHKPGAQHVLDKLHSLGYGLKDEVLAQSSADQNPKATPDAKGGAASSALKLLPQPAQDSEISGVWKTITSSGSPLITVETTALSINDNEKDVSVAVTLIKKLQDNAMGAAAKILISKLAALGYNTSTLGQGTGSGALLSMPEPAVGVNLAALQTKIAAVAGNTYAEKTENFFKDNTTAASIKHALFKHMIESSQFNSAVAVVKSLHESGYNVGALFNQLPEKYQQKLTGQTLAQAGGTTSAETSSTGAASSGTGSPLPPPYTPGGNSAFEYIQTHYTGYKVATKVNKYLKGIGKNQSAASLHALYVLFKSKGLNVSAHNVLSHLAMQGYNVSNIGSSSGLGSSGAAAAAGSTYQQQAQAAQQKHAEEMAKLAEEKQKKAEALAAALAAGPAGPAASKATKVVPYSEKKVEFFQHETGLSVKPELHTFEQVKPILDALKPPDLPSAQQNKLLAESAAWAANNKKGSSIINDWKGSAANVNAAWYKGNVDGMFKSSQLFKLLENAPKWTGPMYRGLHFSADVYKKWMRMIVEDGVLRLDAPQGFSRNYSTASSFSGGPQRVILIVDKAKTARMIEDLHGFKNEAEMIAMPNTHYKVNRFEEFTGKGGTITTYVYLTEM